jgi:hypothetical protein
MDQRDRPDEIEVTLEMAREGVSAWWTHPNGHEPSEGEAQQVVAAIFRAMILAKKKRAPEDPVLPYQAHVWR